MQNPHQKIYNQIENVLNNSENILIVSHIRPDGDALGSLLGFYYYLNKMAPRRSNGVNIEIFINDKNLPQDFNFLCFFNKIKTNEYELLNKNFDTIIILDCGDFKRSGLENILSKNSSKPKTINIDHHYSNNNFGDINLIDLDASSTSEILYNFFKYLNIKFDSTLSTCLLTGLITDTNFFNHTNTTHNTLNASAELVKNNGRMNLILKHIYKNPSVKSLKLCGLALSRLKVNPDNGLATTVIWQEDLEKFKASNDDLIYLNNYLNTLDDVKGTLILKEQSDGSFKGSLRTNRDDVDVEAIAKQYGGGGHKKASGFVCKDIKKLL
ncbi:bifunctional oligoribonuclease/PAP phosphatase NrnA [Candidatus Parcubacteria bacterium]|nr:bifunctional oligoribonuclease/PAP phosphatase NrnA [Patescibacteria group bacterium]MBU4482405.1 bifunctional oligoribonuclease/PAP phosphatase NrnA [Patescibacteria group bacterium]MCG2686610.1 bifunctional oligoribonuclease/PAP phosphatase NrnA [Candidatus Parcubacteria bacterium]